MNFAEEYWKHVKLFPENDLLIQNLVMITAHQAYSACNQQWDKCRINHMLLWEHNRNTLMEATMETCLWYYYNNWNRFMVFLL